MKHQVDISNHYNYVTGSVGTVGEVPLGHMRQPGLVNQVLPATIFGMADNTGIDVTFEDELTLQPRNRMRDCFSGCQPGR